MQSKHSIWLTLTLAILVSSAPRLAFAAQDAPKASPPSPPMTRADKDAQRTIPGPYRLTYTLTEMDGNRRIGSQRYVVVLDPDAPNAHVNMKARLPMYLADSAQYSYEDIGLGMDASLRQYANGVELFTRLNQTELAGDQDSTTPHAPSGSATPHRPPPIIRQSQLETTTLMTENRPMILGQLDKPGSTHSLQIQVELTKLP
jgi:hypothetical protein